MVSRIDQAGNSTRTVAFSPDGRYFLTGTSEGIRLYDRDARLIRQFPLEGGAGSAAFSPDSQYILAGTYSRGEVYLWDLDGRQHLKLSPGSSVAEVGFGTVCADCPEWLMITTGRDQDRRNGFIRIWDRRGNELQRIVTTLDVNRAVAFSPDGRHILAAGQGGNIYVWESIDHYFNAYQELTYAQCAASQISFDVERVRNPGSIARYAALQMSLPFLLNNDRPILQTGGGGRPIPASDVRIELPAVRGSVL